jgi:transcriptional regulator with XRE-family HTH domain
MIAEKLEELRRAKGWTQGDLSKKTGISQVVISRYEKNTKPSKKNFKKLLSVFKLPENYFFDLTVSGGYSKNKRVQNAFLVDLINDLQQFSQDELEIVIAVIEAIKNAKRRNNKREFFRHRLANNKASLKQRKPPREVDNILQAAKSSKV